MTRTDRCDGRQHLLIRRLQILIGQRIQTFGQLCLDFWEHHLLESNVTNGFQGDPVGLEIIVERALELRCRLEQVVLRLDRGGIPRRSKTASQLLTDGLLDDQLKQDLVGLIAVRRTAVDPDGLNLLPTIWPNR